jgi:hypothetical protein
VLLVYAAGTWNAAEVYGAAQVYVNSATGVDAPNNGTAAAPFATWQYAINRFAGAEITGAVTITDNTPGGGTFRETVTIQNISLPPNTSLTLQGVKGADVVASTAVTGAANSTGSGSAGFGTLTAAASWTVHAYNGMFVEILTGTGAGQIFVIHDTASNYLIITGRWSPVPDTTSTFHIFNPGTRITGSNAGTDTTASRSYCIVITTNQQNVVLKMMLLNYAVTAIVYCSTNSFVNVNNCQIQNSNQYGCWATNLGTINVNNCYFTGTTGDCTADYGGSLQIIGCRLNSTVAGMRNLYVTILARLYIYQSYVGKGTSGTAPAIGLYMTTNAIGSIGDYTEFDGCSTDNIYLSTGARLDASARGTPANSRSLNSAGWGLLADTGASGAGVSGLTYAANTAGTYSPTTALPGGNT